MENDNNNYHVVINKLSKLLVATGICYSLLTPAFAAKPVVLGVVEQEQQAPITWYSGTVQSKQEARLSMEATGRLIMVVHFGQQVKKGDILAQVDAKTLALQLKIEKLKEKKAKAYVEHLAIELARLEKLARQRNVSETDQAKARHELSIRQIEWENARLQVGVIHDQLARTKLVAPFDGTVNEVFKTDGEYIDHGEMLLHLVNTDEQEIRLQAPINVTAMLPEAAKLDITSGHLRLQATLHTKSASADPRSRLMELRLLPEGEAMTIGQPVKVAIPNRLKSDGLLVPRDAVVSNQAGSALFVIVAAASDEDEMTVKQIPIDVLYSNGGKVAIQGDIAIGHEIVVRGGSGLTDGQAVVPTTGG